MTTESDTSVTARTPEDLLPGAHSFPMMRRLRLVMLLDTSRSMKGAKIESLNNTVTELVPILRQEATANNVDLQIRCLQFESDASWVDDQWQSIHDYQFVPLAVGTLTVMGQALGLLYQEFSQIEVSNDYPPVLLLITDGAATDRDECEANLRSLDMLPYYKSAVRIPISIGRNPDEEMLWQFCSPHVEQIFTAHNAENLVDMISYAAIESMRQLSQPAAVAPEAIIVPPSILQNCSNDELIY